MAAQGITVAVQLEVPEVCCKMREAGRLERLEEGKIKSGASPIDDDQPASRPRPDSTSEVEELRRQVANLQQQLGQGAACTTMREASGGGPKERTVRLREEGQVGGFRVRAIPFLSLQWDDKKCRPVCVQGKDSPLSLTTHALHAHRREWKLVEHALRTKTGISIHLGKTELWNAEGRKPGVADALTRAAQKEKSRGHGVERRSVIAH